MNEIRKAPVEHILWGAGQVVRRAGNTISIRFESKGVKEFLYPDAFDRYLVMQDAAHQQAVAADLAVKKEADAAALAEAERLHAETIKRQALEKAFLEAKKKKTTRAKKTAAPKKEA